MCRMEFRLICGTTNRNRDMENDKKLLYLGWTIIHFWGQDITKHTDECIKVIEEAIWDNHVDTLSVYDSEDYLLNS